MAAQIDQNKLDELQKLATEIAGTMGIYIKCKGSVAKSAKLEIGFYRESDGEKICSFGDRTLFPGEEINISGIKLTAGDLEAELNQA